jgi:hypothetical protein
MKKSFFTLLVLLSFSRLASAETYVWEDYDDFSDNSLDAGKWDTAYSSGGNAPAEINGKLNFSGNTISGYNQTKVTEAMLEVNPLAQSWFTSTTTNDPHSFLEFIDDELKGLSFEVMIPTGSSPETGIGLYVVDYATTFNSTNKGDASNSTMFDIDLWYSSGKPEIEFKVMNPDTGEEQDIDISCEFDVYYKAGFVYESESIVFYLNDAKVGEFPYNSSGEKFVIRGTNDNGSPFTTYVDNVRVLRSGQTATEPQATTVVSTPDGKPVVVQVGDTYKWSDQMAGVKIFGVSPPSDWGTSVTYELGNGSWTIQFGHQEEGAYSKLYDYAIDADGVIKMTEDSGYEYYKVLSVEGGAIAFSEGNEEDFDPSSSAVDGWFFTTKAAAESYLQSNFPTPDLSVAGPGAFRSRSYVQGSGGTTFKEAEINLDLHLPTKPTVNQTFLVFEGLPEQYFNILKNEGPNGFRAEMRMVDGDDELYDIEKNYATLAEEEADSTATTGAYQFSIVANGYTYTFTHNLPSTSAYAEIPSFVIGSNAQWKQDASSSGDSLLAEVEGNLTITWNAFARAQANDFTEFSFFEISGDDETDIYDEITLPSSQTSFTIDSSLLKPNTSYEAWVGFCKVSQAENPSGFTHASGQDDIDPILRTFTRNATKLSVQTLSQATKGWLWFDEYPWVYSDEEKGWLYFKPSGDKIHYYSVRDKAWREFTPKQP